MREEVVWDLTLGKVVEDFVCSTMNGQMVVCFDDGTFTTFEAMEDYGDGVVIKPCELNLFEFGDRLLVKAGVIDELEMEFRRKKQAVAYQEARENAQRRTYERLKRKFEADDDTARP